MITLAFFLNPLGDRAHCKAGICWDESFPSNCFIFIFLKNLQGSPDRRPYPPFHPPQSWFQHRQFLGLYPEQSQTESQKSQNGLLAHKTIIS